MPTADATQSANPVEKPIEPIDQIRRLDALIRQHDATARSREQELVAMLGSSDVEAILAERPELLTERGEDILRISEMRRLALIALRGANKRLAVLGPVVLLGLGKHEARIRDLHADNMARVRAHVARKLCDVGLDEGALNYAVNRSKLVREELIFQQAHPCDPVRLAWMRGEDGNAVLRDPHAGLIVQAYDKTMANLAATEAHTREIHAKFSE